jgi:hypothetical protein
VFDSLAFDWRAFDWRAFDWLAFDWLAFDWPARGRVAREPLPPVCGHPVGSGSIGATRPCFTGCMGETWIPWAGMALLVVVVIVMGVWRKRDAARARAREAESGEANRRVLEQRDTDHRTELERRDQDARNTAAELEQFKRAASRRIEWELVARGEIVSVCEELGIDGVVATNIVFVPFDSSPASPFVTQVDHVLLTERCAVVIETKNWRGVVFDEKPPSSVHAGFGALIPDEILPASFAVKLAPTLESGRVEVLSKIGKRAPRSQVRLHAKRLSRLMLASLGRSLWFDTMVYYSHPEVVLYAAETGAGGVDTPAVAGRMQLRQALTRFQRGTGRTGVPVDDVARILSEVGADVRGFGSFSARWTSPLSDDDARWATRQRAESTQNSLPSGSVRTTHDSSPV